MSFYKKEIKGGKLIISDESIDILMDAFQNKGEEMPKNISWNFIATVLLAGSYFFSTNFLFFQSSVNDLLNVF